MSSYHPAPLGWDDEYDNDDLYDGPADEDNPYLNPDLLPLPADARHEHDKTL